MKQVWVRPLEPSDLPKLQEWMTRIASENLFDPDVLSYPHTVVLVAHDGEPLLYMPVQLTATLESLAPRPGATPREMAEALKQMVKAVAFLSHGKGIKEVYFVCKDPDVVELAKRHGFEEMPTTLRLKLNQLEGSSNVQE